jgi:hypothetical protein
LRITTLDKKIFGVLAGKDYWRLWMGEVDLFADFYLLGGGVYDDGGGGSGRLEMPISI